MKILMIPGKGDDLAQISLVILLCKIQEVLPMSNKYNTIKDVSNTGYTQYVFGKILRQRQNQEAYCTNYNEFIMIFIDFLIRNLRKTLQFEL